MAMSNVRNGQWITRPFSPGTILSADDDLSLEQMRLDTLTEDAARALARVEELHTRLVAVNHGDDVQRAHYPDLLATQAAARATVETISHVVRLYNLMDSAEFDGLVADLAGSIPED